MPLTPRAVIGAASWLANTAQNALEVARFGGLQTGDRPAPFEVVSRQRMYRLRRYFPDSAAERPAVVLVPPLMLTAEVYDVAEDKSAVRILAGEGIDPWVVDFGSPEHEEGGLLRTLTDHVLAVSEAVDTVRTATGRDVHLAGYSQGGMFSYQAAAYRRSAGLASVITFGSPVDTRGMVPFGIPNETAIRALNLLGGRMFAERGIPGWAARLGFKLLDPVKSLRQRVEFIRQLHDREALLAREAQRRFLDSDGFVAFPGPALRDVLDQFGTHNRLLSGGFVIDGRLVTLADITCPILCFVGEIDSIAPRKSVRAIRRAAPVPEIYERSLRAGHFGLVVGSLARDRGWPTTAAWARWREGCGEKPADIAVLTETAAEPTTATAVARATYGVGLAAGVGAGVVRSSVGVAVDTVASARQLAFEAAHQLPRLARLDSAGPDTRISASLLLDEQARRSPGATFFLFADRGHTYADAQRRFDNIVRGLIAVGVRQGDHVGVLMDTRPSALAVIVALNRLGAVAVVMRPDGSIAQEAQLGQVSRIIADPEHAPAAESAASVPVLVLGGGRRPRELGSGITDMERINPDEMALPAWYVPNPGRGRDLAFVLFTGVGENTRVNRITNRRWALSAFGTASAAALTTDDTVYSVTPIHHPSCLLTSIGGAVAAGARLALTTRFEPATFWDEVRRYGVTVVSYTWTLTRALVEAPPHPAEVHHPVRLFVGSGMPKPLWRRTLERFAPARVLRRHGGRGGAGQRLRRQDRGQGPAASGQCRGPRRGVRHRRRTAPRGARRFRRGVRRRRDRHAPGGSRPDPRQHVGLSAAGAVRPGRRVAGDRRPVLPRRGRRPLVHRHRPGAHPHRARRRPFDPGRGRARRNRRGRPGRRVRRPGRAFRRADPRRRGDAADRLQAVGRRCGRRGARIAGGAPARGRPRGRRDADVHVVPPGQGPAAGLGDPPCGAAAGAGVVPRSCDRHLPPARPRGKRAAARSPCPYRPGGQQGGRRGGEHRPGGRRGGEHRQAARHAALSLSRVGSPSPDLA